MSITIHTREVATLLLSLAMLTAFIIIAFRYYFNNVNLKPHKSSAHRTKYEIIDIFKYRNSILLCSIGISLALCLSLISWTQQDRFIQEIRPYTIDEDIETIPPITYFTPPPIVPQLIIEIPNDNIEELDQNDLLDMSLDETSIIEAPPVVTVKSEVAELAPPPPLKKKIVEDLPEIIGFAEKMPLFGGCVDKTCSDKALMNYLYANLKYPVIARENRLEGRVFIQFVVETDGRISGVKVVRDIGGSCGEAAKKAVESMNELDIKWTPGKQNGRAVRVLFTLPVTFKLAE